MKKEMLIKETIEELNEKTKNLWKETLSDADFIKKARRAGLINILGKYYRVCGCTNLENDIDFWIEESDTERFNKCKELLKLRFEDGKRVFLDADCTRDLKLLAEISMNKYRISKEIIKQVEERYKKTKK